MPNYFAHLTFGAKVLEGLSAVLAGELLGERAAFDLGCLGPDPLFFYRPLQRSRVRREGMSIHKVCARPVLERLRRSVAEGEPQAKGYAAGFLCHLVLDSLCHPYVEARAAEGPVGHLAIEAEFDRVLMEEYGVSTRGESHMHSLGEAAVYEAAAEAYLQTGAQEVREGHRRMIRDTRRLARLCGTRRGRVVTRVFKIVPPLRPLVGIILEEAPCPDTIATSAVLHRLWEEAVPVGVEQVTAFFDAVAHGLPLSDWLLRDFSGSPCEA